LFYTFKSFASSPTLLQRDAPKTSNLSEKFYFFGRKRMKNDEICIWPEFELVSWCRWAWLNKLNRKLFRNFFVKDFSNGSSDFSALAFLSGFLLSLFWSHSYETFLRAKSLLVHAFSTCVYSENTKHTGNYTIPLSTWFSGFKYAVQNNNNKNCVFKKNLY